MIAVCVIQLGSFGAVITTLFRRIRQAKRTAAVKGSFAGEMRGEVRPDHGRKPLLVQILRFANGFVWRNRAYGFSPAF